MSFRRTYKKSSDLLAPTGFRTPSWTWRAELKQNDLADIYDTQGCWVIGTILAVRESEPGRREVHVGYRVYCEAGSKADATGRKFEGWSESFDEDIFVNSLRIQPYGSIAELG